MTKTDIRPLHHTERDEPGRTSCDIGLESGTITKHRSASRLRALAVIPLAIALAGTAQATDRRPADAFTVYAEVVQVQPVYSEYRSREPRQECWIEVERHAVREGRVGYSSGSDRGQRHSGSSAGDALVGGVIGGVIGNQLGRNSSRGARTGATVAGAVIGSAIANEASAGSSRHRRRHEPRHVPRTVYETREVERCRTVETVREQRRIQHYDVTYRYEGRTFTTRQPRDPGRRIKLRLSLTPADQ